MARVIGSDIRGSGSPLADATGILHISIRIDLLTYGKS